MAAFLTLWFALAIIGAVAAPVHAQSSSIMAGSPWVETDHTKVRLVAATAATGDAEDVRLGLQFQLIPGWKVYWRSPGAAGFPPHIDWTGSSNLSDATILWPAPHRFSVLGLDTLGYTDEVVFPIDVRLERPGDPLIVDARVSYLTCDEICVPYEAKLALTLPAGGDFPSPHGVLIDRFAAQVPGDGVEDGLAFADAVVTGSVGEQVLRAAARSSIAFHDPDLFVEGPDIFEYSAPNITYSDDRREATFEIEIATIGNDLPDFAGSNVVLTLVDGSRALEASVDALPGEATAPGFDAFLGILAIAVLGGLILNLMPCVLPVLSLKLLSVVKHGGGVAQHVRAGFLATAAGIVFSFLVIAGALIAVQSAGMAVGWGIQFQQPIFLVAMTVILTLFAANLWGIFEIRLPGGLGDRLGRPGTDATLGGHFLTGAFATLLATPCSAPFLGTAIGFALSRGALEIVLVFLALGIGLAIPYLLVAVFPVLATRLPRPGVWINVLRRILGAALLVTAIWLLSILATLDGMAVALAVGIAMVIVTAVLWVGKRLLPPARLATWFVAVAVAAFAMAAPTALREQPSAATAAVGSEVDWSPFAVGEIATLVRSGKVVFVDVTADWCLTCKVNKRLVLDTDPVAAEIAGDDVVAMVADWTRPDDQISAFLARFGRYGIPFDVVFGPGAPRGLPLPELLTSDAVMEAIRRAGAGG